MSKTNHSRGLCGKPDMAKYGKAQNDTNLPLRTAEADPPQCRCCGHEMRVVPDSLSAGFQQLGMYELLCDTCP